MKKREYKIKSKVFLYPGMSGWHFAHVPKKDSAEIKKNFGDIARGWGSFPVEVTVRGSIWKTSIFPDKQSGTYLLPLKASVRKAEGILSDDEIKIELKIKI